MSANDSWQNQGRQAHGRFGSGTSAVAAAAASPGGTATGKPRKFGQSYAWRGSRAVRAAAVQVSGITATTLPRAPSTMGPFVTSTIVPDSPYFGPVAAELAQRRLHYAAGLIRSGDIATALEHLFGAKPYPAEVDHPMPASPGIAPMRAPGMPGKQDGFVPKKNWDGKIVRAPNGRGYGFPDAYGDVWVPTGEGDDAHGGPHWDVQEKNGDRRNVLPGGKVRK